MTGTNMKYAIEVVLKGKVHWIYTTDKKHALAIAGALDDNPSVTTVIAYAYKAVIFESRKNDEPI